MNPLLQQGLAHHQAGRLREAELAYRQILSREPNHPDALHLLGVIATHARQYQAAIQLIEAAIRNKPGVAFYYNNLGNAQRATGELGWAETSYRRALELEPGSADPLVNLGTVLRDQARFDESAEAYQNAIRLHPNSADAHASLGTVFKDQGRIDEALATYRRAIELDPNHVSASNNLLYTLHDSDQVTPAEIFDAHRRWALKHAEPLTASAPPHANDRNPARRLRIGLVSPDLRGHPVGRFMWPLIQHRDRSQLELIAFASVEGPDRLTAEYRQGVDEWHDVLGVGEAQLAELIRSRRIDILIDLAGHTGGGRMLAFARRPAPVQIAYLGYPDTAGMSAIDVRITDALADPPPTADARYVERLARMEGCFLCYPLAADAPAIVAPPAQSAGHVTFGSFNSLAKISPTTIRLWTSVLNAVPTARLVIKTTRLGDAGTRRRAAERFAALGMPMERVELLGPLKTQREHLSAYAGVDIALDTFPYNGTTTTCEALVMGVPVVSLVGEHHAARVGLTILTAVCGGEGASDDPERFVTTAKELAADIPRLAQVRAELRDRMSKSVLCDGAGFTRKFETILRDEWVRWCRG